MSKNNNHEQMSKRVFLERIARMYYILGLTQKEVAEQMNIGRSSVARFLNEAREEGIIQFHIQSKSEKSRRSDLENLLINKFKLKDALVVKKDQGYSFETTVVNYLNSILPFQGSLGLGLGHTMNSVGQFLHLCESRPNLNIIQMSGSVGMRENNIPSTSVIQSWAQSIDARPFFLPAPAILDNKETRDLFLKDENIRKVKQEILNIDIAIIGIGHVGEDSAIISSELVSGLTVEELQKNSVGDVNLHFFDRNGELSMQWISERVTGASPLDLMRIPTRVGIAYGEKKINAILGALRGRFINVLLTNDETANLLLSDAE
ncbi:sugar-binding transcriptional regulator [Bacillus sp. Marseille-P3661]|uniref:sugar-binding transcriptional regulator n=1 Tax=Bacillus sp. Marseille-P3661 TaxID=1936234 RepID=UPI000C852510|nr:sugar-binding domain-containing protein [Bacillus sp. Marseille-P3661]